MNGILNILKPPGMTSFDIVARVRGLLKTKKTGHTGTLDPMAVGVLPVCLGNATKAIEFMMEKDKLYRAELTLGIITDTQDASGEILEKRDAKCTNEEIEVIIKSFTGQSQQLPPMYSAIKINGRRLYEMAREGITIDRTPRAIEIYYAEIIDIKRDNGIKVLFDVHCSKGTYIRTLCADIGEKLGCGGHMSFLLRKRAGAFDLSTAVTLEELKHAVDEGSAATLLVSSEKVFAGFNSITLEEIQEKKLQNGMVIDLAACGGLDEGLTKVYNSKGIFFALGEITRLDNRLVLKSRKLFLEYAR